MRRLLNNGDLLRASDENAVLHRTLLEVADHPTVMRLISMLKSQLVRFQYRTIMLPGRTERSFEEHSAIVDAVAAGDPDGAEKAMRRHLSHVAEALRGASN
jgi:DNA-binding GntR family transcriptional regulator